METKKDLAIKAEYFVLDELQKRGMKVEYVDDWFDITADDEKIEIKSCAVAVKNGKGVKMLGRFDFTNSETLKRQHEENIMYCFVLRHRASFLILGFQRANVFKEKRYIRLAETLDYYLLDIDEFVRMKGVKL